MCDKDLEKALLGVSIFIVAAFMYSFKLFP